MAKTNRILLIYVSSRTDAAPVSRLDLDTYSVQDLDSEFDDDSDVELDFEGIYPNQSGAASPVPPPTEPHGLLLYSNTEVSD